MGSKWEDAVKMLFPTWYLTIIEFLKDTDSEPGEALHILQWFLEQGEFCFNSDKVKAMLDSLCGFDLEGEPENVFDDGFVSPDTDDALAFIARLMEARLGRGETEARFSNMSYPLLADDEDDDAADGQAMALPDCVRRFLDGSD
jgi:hypothetical protein